MAPLLRTQLTEMLGIENPVMLAGMGGIAGKELVAAVCNAGGFGTFGAAVDVANLGPDELRAELAELRQMCNGRPYGVDLLVHGAEGGVMGQLVDIFANEGAKAFISGRGFPRREVIDKFHSRGMLVGSIAGRVVHAVRAVEEGVDFIIGQGTEAGGHTGSVATSVLIPQIVDAVGGKVPVVAAGGVYDGRGLAAALSYGAAGVWMSDESYTHTKYKERLLAASTDDTTVTRAFTGYPLRAIKNSYSDDFEKEQSEDGSQGAMQGMKATKDGVWQLHSDGGHELPDGGVSIDIQRQAFVTGQCIGGIDTLKPAAEIVQEMVQTAHSIFTSPSHFSTRSKL